MSRLVSMPGSLETCSFICLISFRPLATCTDYTPGSITVIPILSPNTPAAFVDSRKRVE